MKSIVKIKVQENESVKFSNVDGFNVSDRKRWFPLTYNSSANYFAIDIFEGKIFVEVNAPEKIKNVGRSTKTFEKAFEIAKRKALKIEKMIELI